MKIADATTWGNHRACFVLEEKINASGNREVLKRVNKVISSFSNLTRGLRKVEDAHRKTAIKIISKHYETSVSDDNIIPEELKSYVKNILSRQARRYSNGELSSNDKTIRK